MTHSLLDQLIGISPEELALLRKLKEVSAASADELAVKLNRAGDDLTPEINDLLRRNLIQSKRFKHGDDEFEVFLASSDVRPFL